MKRLLVALTLAALAAVPAAQTAEARQTKQAICHFDEDEGHYVRIKVAAPAAEKHLNNHEFDVSGDGVDCSALPDPRQV